MSITTARPGLIAPADVEGWLVELGLAPEARTERDGVVAWDLELDGRRRFDVPVTLILDPRLALIVWVHFAPPIGDGLRKAYRTLLRWNDEFPFAKFSLAEDGRPILMAELPIAGLDADVLGLALARLLLICDRLLEESAGWLWIGGRIPDRSERRTRNPGLFTRFGDRLAELLAS
jgi:putative sensory transduction regulator